MKIGNLVNNLIKKIINQISKDLVNNNKCISKIWGMNPKIYL